MSEQETEALDVRVEPKYDAETQICSVDFGVEGFAMVHVRWSTNGSAVAAELLAAGPQILEQVVEKLEALIAQAASEEGDEDA